MSRFLLLLWGSLLLGVEPSYTVGGVVNAASGQVGSAAPNTILSIYGNNLSNGTHALTTDEMRDGSIPSTMQGTRVLLAGGLLANLYFVSPAQINLLIPATFKPGKTELIVLADGHAGPPIQITLTDASPGLFLDGKYAVATTADGVPLTPSRTAHPGEVITLYATGLGPTADRYGPGELAGRAAFVTRFTEFRVLVAAAAVDASRVLYAGVTPGFAGLYQINLRLPEDCPDEAAIQVGYDGNMSPDGPLLRVRREQIATSQ